MTGHRITLTVHLGIVAIERNPPEAIQSAAAYATLLRSWTPSVQHFRGE